MKKLLLILMCLPFVSIGQASDFSFYFPTDDGFADNHQWEHDFFINPQLVTYPDSAHGMFTGLGTIDVHGCMEYFNTSPPLIKEVCLTDDDVMNLCYTFTLDVNNRYETFVMSGYYLFFSPNITSSFYYNNQDELIEVVNNDDGNYSKTEFTYLNNNITKIEHYDTNIISTPIQTDILTYNNNELIAVSVGSDTEFEYHYNSTNGLYAITYKLNNNFVDTVAKYTFNNVGFVTSYEFKDYDYSTYLNEYKKEVTVYNTNNTEVVNTETLIYDNFSSTWETEEFMNLEYNTLCGGITSVNEIIEGKRILRIIDALGRETTPKPNTPLFYIYDDGTVEKRIVIE